MEKSILTISDIEETALALKKLYARHGYRKFKMSRFEEFGFYMENRSFLEDDRITAFSDPSGKLLALRPDVTLSIVKNARGEAEKVYYGEYVYRTAKNSSVIDEILQVGLERIAPPDAYGIGEAVWLALESLAMLSDDFILDVSHMGLLTTLLSELGVPGSVQGDVILSVGEKNPHDTVRLLMASGLDEGRACEFAELAVKSGSFEEMLPLIRAASGSAEIAAIADELEALRRTLAETGLEGHMHIDLSVINDMSYYNGIVFAGYVFGVPFRVLSGGRYDRLLEKLGKSGAAIGFAVYLGKLERYAVPKKRDADILLVYDSDATPAEVMRTMRMLSENGAHVTAARSGDTLSGEYGARYHIGRNGVTPDA